MDYLQIQNKKDDLLLLLGASLRSPISARCVGVDMDIAMSSPMASWKPSLAPSLQWVRKIQLIHLITDNYLGSVMKYRPNEIH